MKIKFYNSPMFFIGCAIFILISIFCLITPFFISVDPLDVSVVQRLKPPSIHNLMGTDEYGRDLFSRVVYGGSLSLQIGFSVTGLSLVFGVLIGLFSAYYPKLDKILMRIIDGIMAIPAILLAIAMMSAFEPSTRNVIIALTIVYSPSTARLVRAKSMEVKQSLFIKAIKTQGASTIRIMFIHILPNILNVLLVQATIIFAESIISEASLSFLGAGIPAPAPSWGNIIQSGKLVWFKAWWVVLFPSLMIFFSVLSLHMIAEGLRSLLSPKKKIFYTKRQKRKMLKAAKLKLVNEVVNVN